MRYIYIYLRNIFGFLLVILILLVLMPLLITCDFIWFISIGRLKHNIKRAYYDFFRKPYIHYERSEKTYYKSEFHYLIGFKPLK